MHRPLTPVFPLTMVLVTRCPHCETVFRLQEAMLARSGGFARCGHCHQVFDARSNLLDPHAGTHNALQESAPAAASLDTDGEADPRDEHREPAPGAGPETWPASAEMESSAHGAPDFAEPPISAEVPPLIAPVFAPEGMSSREAEPREPQLGGEDEPLSESKVESLSEPGAEPPSESEAEPPSESVEPAGDERTPSAREADWSSHWHDDEPHLRGGMRSEAAAEPSFGGAPARPRTRTEPELAPRGGAPEETERVEGEPHLEPHLRARRQAQAEEEAQVEPRFGATSDDPRPRAAGAPPLFAEPPTSSEHQRHFAVTRETRARSPRRTLGYLVGGIVALALIVVLIAQLAWWRREAVMVYWPDSQALFARVCTQLGCQVLPPRDIDGLQVEASDLRQIDGPHRLELRVPLRNRYGIALAYPAIDLTLFDSKNDIAIRRILWPQDYLPPGTTVAGGLPAHTTQTMIVRLDSGNAIATNFRVQIFYP